MIDVRDYTASIVGSLGPICCVYVIFAAVAKRTKIGISKNIRSRFSALQTDSPEELTIEYILWCLDGKNVAIDIEQKCHEVIGGYHSHGEWFYVPPKFAIEKIEDIRDRFYPKREKFYTHQEFIEKTTDRAKILAESANRRGGLTASELDALRKIQRSGYI